MSQMPLIADKTFALMRIEEVLEDNLVITDLKTIDLYDTAFQNILPEPWESWASIIGELRWRFIKSNPKDEDASKECFRACLLKNDLDNAIKVCVAARAP